MFVCCWSPKGGSGTSVVAAALGVLAAREHGSALLVDLAGDALAVLGVAQPPPDHPAAGGLATLLAPGSVVPADGLAGIEVDAGGGLAVVSRGGDPIAEGADPGLVALLDGEARPVVVDLPAGPHGGDAWLRRLEGVERVTTLLVVRPCYLALRRATHLPRRPDGVVVVAEAGRALRATDVAEVTGAPVVAEVPVAPAIARTVDAGLLAGRLPTALERALRPLVEPCPVRP